LNDITIFFEKRLEKPCLPIKWVCREIKINEEDINEYDKQKEELK
jgi:hypothetical protein